MHSHHLPDELQPGNPNHPETEAGSPWTLSRFREVDSVRPVRREGSGTTEKITSYKLSNRYGRTEILSPGKECYILRHASGGSISLDVESAWHISYSHMRSERFSSRFDKAVQLDGLMELLAKHLGEPPSFRAPIAQLEVDVGRPIGTDSVISREEIRQRGELTEEDLKHLNLVRNDVLDLNTNGKLRQKELFVAGFNQAFASEHMQLTVRPGPRYPGLKEAPQDLIIPQYITERPERTTVVVGVRRHGQVSRNHHLTTMYPGQLKGGFPNSRRYWGGTRYSGQPDGLNPAELYERQASGTELSPEQQRFLARYEYAQRMWYDTYGVVE